MIAKIIDALLGKNTTPQIRTSPRNDFKRKFPAFFDDYEDESDEEQNGPISYTPRELKDTSPWENSLPVLPLRNLVIFPEMIVPVLVGRRESVRSVEHALKTNKKVVVVAQRDENKGYPDPDHDLYRVGVVGEVIQNLRMPDDSLRLVVAGLSRAEIDHFYQTDDLLMADFFALPDKKVKSEIELEATRRYVADLFTNYIKLAGNISEDLLVVVENMNDITRHINVLAGFLPGSVEVKQDLLETLDIVERMKKIGALLAKECQIYSVGKKIKEKASSKLQQAEKEYYLKEQLHAIEEELKTNGSGEGDEFDIMLSNVKKKKLSAPAAKQVKHEIDRLKKIPSFSPEAGLIRSYIDLIFDLPWYKKTKENLDLNEVQKVLDQDHYGLEKPKERITEFLAVRKLAPRSKGPILCFVGPPGTGKTSLARSVARALGRKYIRISLGGVRDEAEIRGHRRTYLGALPGRIINGMKQAEVTNPMILLDEVDKMDSDLRGDPTAALLEVLDQEQNHEFVDHFLEIPYDLSQVLFITTANITYSIPEPLQDRLEIIQLSSYTEEEKIEIAKRHLVPKQIKEHGLKQKREPQFSDRILRNIIKEYTKEAGVRELERSIAKICRRIAKEIVQSKKAVAKQTVITNKLLQKYLGNPKFLEEEKEKENQIGVATGLAWTEVGGTILPVEVVTMPGKGNLTITGQIGEVMQESAKAALSYIRAREKQFGLPKGFHDKLDLHIHVPEGAVPKDGPSAGIAIASAIVSALTHKPINANIAMTGEITLRGNVLPIGGLKEKILAAHRAGIGTVIIPGKNERDLSEIPSKIRKKMSIAPVDNMDQVVKNVLMAPALSPVQAPHKTKKNK